MGRKITHDEHFTGQRETFASVAQTVEQRIENPCVVGSTPTRSTKEDLLLIRKKILAPIFIPIEEIR